MRRHAWHRGNVVCVLLGLFWVAGLSAAEPGTLILHGGGNISSALRDRFVEWAGGAQARLVVIPTADPDHPEDVSRLESWRLRQPASVQLLHTSRREEAEKEAFAEPLRQATGVWISGGRQSLLAAIYRETPVERELAAVLRRGGVVGGTSAGAAILSRVMLFRGEIGQGFDLAPDCIIDQHFLARRRQSRLWQAVEQHSERVGVGIDEDTAAIIRGSLLTVEGDSTVTLCLAPRGRRPQSMRELRHGQQIDLRELLSAE